MNEPKPTFATNTDDRLVADALRDFLTYPEESWRKPFELSVATAYLNPGGFGLLADVLERVPKVRLLLGVDPDQPVRRIRHLDDDGPEYDEERRIERALEGQVRSIAEDRDLLGFTYEVDAITQRLVRWLRSDAVEVRRYEQGFLHGKAYIVGTDDHGVIAGSSNLTYAGLALNQELNLGQYDPATVAKVREWFDRLWDASVPFDLAEIFDVRYQEHSPYLIFLRMLWERYGRELEEEADDISGGLIDLTSFQQDGVWRAKRILQRYGGVLIADGVGLGKSFLAGALMEEARLRHRQRVLLIAPAALRDSTWARFQSDTGLHIDTISYEQLASDRRINPKATGRLLPYDLAEYALIVIDEAHAFRNPDTQRAAALRNLLQLRPEGLAPDAEVPPKRLVLLTATPVNNSLFDLYYLLQYFLRHEGVFADLGIPNLKEHFEEAMAVDPDDLSADHLFDVLDSVAVRRTRHFVKQHYANERIKIGGVERVIEFPTPVVKRVDYDFDAVLPAVFHRFARAMGADVDDEKIFTLAPDLDEVPDDFLTFAAYMPSSFLRVGQPSASEVQVAGLLRSGLLKRFESSVYAFGKTCERMADYHDQLLDLMGRGYVARGKALAEWAATDSDDLEEYLAGHDDDVDNISDYRADDLREAVENDRGILRSFASEALSVKPEDDPKLRVLTNALAEIAEEAVREGIGSSDRRNKRKVIVFSYFADTARWVANWLERATVDDPRLSDYRDRCTLVTGDEGDKTDALWGFAPRTASPYEGAAADEHDRYDLLVATDVLAEGTNLQQARHIINYDLPWNPMRLVQRHGRIDRIGSEHPRVFLRCVFPDKDLDELLGLEQRLLAKIARAAASVGVENEVIPGSRTGERVFAETAEEIRRLQDEDSTLFETGGETGNAFSGEEYRQELREGLKTHRDEVLALAWGSGSGMAVAGAEPGYVFCARVGDHPHAQFRYVRYADTAEPEIVRETLACLAHAHATPETVRVLDVETHKRAYEAWALAKEDIRVEWMKRTDHRALQPKIPKVMREASELLATYRPDDLDQKVVDRMIEALQADRGARISNRIRAAMRRSDDPHEQARDVAAVVAELNLEPPGIAEPLPLITEDDVHLVCWQAIVPG